MVFDCDRSSPLLRQPLNALLWFVLASRFHALAYVVPVFSCIIVTYNPYVTPVKSLTVLHITAYHEPLKSPFASQAFGFGMRTVDSGACPGPALLLRVQGIGSM